MGRHFFFNSLFSRNFRNKISQLFANLTQILQTFLKFGTNLIAGKYMGPIDMGPIMGPNLVNVWVSFHFTSGTSLPKRFLSYPPQGFIGSSLIGYI